MTNKIAIHNAQTQETEIREMTEQELAAHKEFINSTVSLQELQTKKIVDKAALLDKLGITAEEAALLLG